MSDGGRVHILRRDPMASDDRTEGFSLGDIAVNVLTGVFFYLADDRNGWVEIPAPS